MILSGKELSDNIKSQLAVQVATFPSRYGRVPHLAVVLVGDDPASATYVKNKGRACEKIGIQNSTIHLPAETSEEALLEQIRLLNEDEGVDGILVQLPLPAHIDELKALYAIAREKDVDGFHPENVAALWRRRTEPETNPQYCVPCTPRGIIRLLKAANVQIEGKRAVVVGRSNIVGLPTSKLLLNENATVSICHSRTVGLAEIDVGIDHGEDGKLCGDVDFEAVKEVASVITPVPGGVGPMTICSLMENTIDCFINRQQ